APRSGPEGTRRMRRGSVRRAARDPLEDAGELHARGPFRRGLAEFLRLPLVMTAAFTVAAVLVSLLDRLTGTGPVRHAVALIVPDEAAQGVIQAVATSLLTVTSITFSVLLVAVQQTASSLTPVIFDQFLRRVANQAYLGFFVGVTAFSFVALGLARAKPAPVYAATLTLLLTLAALVTLLMLIHATIDQMRPQTVVRSIQDLALSARERELALIGRTRPERSRPAGAGRVVAARDSGYVVAVDVESLGGLADRAGRDAEVVVIGCLGDSVIYGDPLVELAGVDADDDRFDEEALAAFRLDDVRSVRIESDYAIDQLENIAWATGTSASQSPATAGIAIRALRDIGARWLLAGERDRSGRAERSDVLPVVYPDDAIERVFGALAALVVGAAESRQAETCATLLRTFAGLARRLRTDDDRAAFADCLDAALPAVIQQARLPVLARALAELENSLGEAGLPNERVVAVHRLLDGAQARLLPKPSDDPEATHPSDENAGRTPAHRGEERM
ncbi:MAG: DUF2254 family protein, partial [Amnibacterium sp.]